MQIAMLLDQIWFASATLVVLLSVTSIDYITDPFKSIGRLTLITYTLGYLAWIIIFAYGALKKPEVLSWVVRRVLLLPGLRRFGRNADSTLQDLQERATILRSWRLVFFLNGLGFGLFLLAWASRYALVVLIVAATAPEID